MKVTIDVDEGLFKDVNAKLPWLCYKNQKELEDAYRLKIERLLTVIAKSKTE